MNCLCAIYVERNQRAFLAQMTSFVVRYDFILSVIGEELGLVGILLILALFFIFFYRGIKIALSTSDLFSTYMAIGITVLVGLQATIHMGVTMGLLPTKGISLPFVSYGGSSLLTNLIGLGILLNISSKTKKDQKYL